MRCLLDALRLGASCASGRPGVCGRVSRPGQEVSAGGGGTVAEAGLPGTDDCLGAVGDVQFGEDVGDVVAYRLGTDDEAAGDVAVVSALGDQVQHLPLPLGQLGE